MVAGDGLRVAFVKYFHKASTILGADQMAEALRCRGVDAVTVRPGEIATLDRSILVFVKKGDLRHLLAAHCRGHRTVLDLQDTVVFKRGIKFRSLYDGVIFKNAAQLRDFGRPGRPETVLYHQWDPRLRPHAVPAGELRPAYLGDPRSAGSWGSHPGVEFVDTTLGIEWFERARAFNVHISARETERERLYKPNCKISTAAACGALLIAVRDQSSVELLGPDYPFFIEPSKGADGLEDALRAARSGLGGAAWADARARLQRVRVRTAIDRVAAEAERFLESLAPLARVEGALRRDLRRRSAA